MSYDDVHAVDLRQCWRGGNRHSSSGTTQLRSRPTMLSERIKYVVAVLLVGLALLAASRPAVAHGLHREGHFTEPHGNTMRADTSTSILARTNALPPRAAYDGSKSFGGSVPSKFLRIHLPETTGSQMLRSFSLLTMTSCEHAGACSCCGANAGCCGMSCCAATLPVSAPTLPNADGTAFAASAFELFQTTNLETLLRPPRPLV